MDWITKNGKSFPVHNKGNFDSPKEKELPIYMSRGFGNKGNWNMLVKGSGNKNNKYGEQPLIAIKREEALKLKNNYKFKSVPTGYEGGIPESIYHLSGESKAFVKPSSINDNQKSILKDWVEKNPDWTSIDDLPTDIFIPLVEKAGSDIDKRVKIQTDAIKFMESIKPKKAKQPKPVKSDYEYDTSDKHQIPKTILEQLKASKVNGFPFFNYTGINDYVMLGNEGVMLKKIPTNPNKITGIDIYYDAGRDAYNVYFEKGIFPHNKRVKGYKEVYVDQMASIMVDEMGVR